MHFKLSLLFYIFWKITLDFPAVLFLTASPFSSSHLQQTCLFIAMTRVQISYWGIEHTVVEKQVQTSVTAKP